MNIEELKTLEPYPSTYIKENEEELRQDIIKISEKWINSKYHIGSCIPYKFVDCMTLAAAIYTEARLIKFPEIKFYRPDFSCHSKEETYLNGIKQYGTETKEYKAGNLLIFKYIGLIDHVGIIIDSDKNLMIDTCISRGCTIQDYSQPMHLSRFMGIYSIF
jgi:cell wall-associated NlpC family hydrolase